MEYWAAKDTESIASEIQTKFANYQHWLYRTGYANRIKLSYDTFYDINKDGAISLKRDEDTGVTKQSNNHYKNLLKRLHILITQNKLSFQPRSNKNDSSSLIDADLGKGLLEYYQEDLNMHSIFSEAALTSLICLESWVHCPWNEDKGRQVRPDETGSLIFEGDQAFEVYTALDVGRSTTLISSWYIVRQRVNKYDLAAKYPQFAESILSISLESTYEEEFVLDPSIDKYLENADDDEACYKYILYHDRTPALPEGRMVEVCASEVLVDKPLEDYVEIPLYRLKAGDFIQTYMSDSPGIELLPLQQAIDLLASATLSNNLNNAVQNIWSPDPNMTIKRISDTQNMITSAQRPEGINFTKSADETYKLLDMMIQNQQLLSGVNETTRGSPQASLKSGNSLALMLAQAIQYVSDLQKNYAQLASDVGSTLINNLKRFAKTERIAYIVGSNKKTYAKIFKAEDLAAIDRIAVDLGNPILQSQAGRWELVQMMTQYGLVQDPRLIASFLRTGEIDQTTDDEFKDHILIKQENEMLLKGEMPTVVITDLHPDHIMKHKSVFNDPDVRSNPQIMEVALAHIQEHIAQMRGIDPTLAQMLGMKPLPPENPPPGPENQDQIAEVNPGGQMDEGVNLPTVPPGTPPQAAEAYGQVMQANQ